MFKIGQILPLILTALMALIISPSESEARNKRRNSCSDALNTVVPLPALTSLRPSKEITSLKFMSYNGEDLHLTGSGRKPVDKLSEIGNIVGEIGPDLLMMVEIGGQYDADRIANLYFNGRYRAMVVNGNDQRKIGIFIKRDLPLEVQVITHSHLTWVDPIDHETKPLFSRDLPAFIFRRSGDTHGKPVMIVFGQHAKSMNDRHGDPKSTTLRTAQFEMTTQILAQFERRFGADVPVVLAGDFNTDVRSSKEISSLLQRMMDAFEITGVPPPERVTHTFHPKKNVTERTQLDSVMVNPALRDSILNAEVYRYKNANGDEKAIPNSSKDRAQNPSDHFPIVIEFSTEWIFPEAHQTGRRAS